MAVRSSYNVNVYGGASAGAASPPAAPTGYYVSNTGSDSADGLNADNAWQTIAKVNAQSFSPNDNIFFNKGDVWREELVIPSSGSAEGYITFSSYGAGANPQILGSTQAITWTATGTANVWQSATSLSDPVTGTIFFIETDLEVTWGIEVDYDAPFTNMSAEYDWCWNANVLYVYAATDPDARYNSIEATQRVASIQLSGEEYIEINGIDMFYQTQGGVREDQPTGNLTGYILRNCEIAYNGTEDGYGYGSHVCYNDALYENNTIHDCGRRSISIYNYGTSNISNNIVQDCYFYNGLHTLGVDMAAGSTSGDTGDIYNTIFRRNILESRTDIAGSSSAGFSVLVNAFGGEIDGVAIYDNLLLHTDGSGVYFRGIVSNLTIYNNTFWGMNPLQSNTQSFIYTTSIQGNPEPIVKNNIFYNNSIQAVTTYAPCIFLSDGGGDANYDQITCDYNLYWTTDAAAYVFERYGGPGGSLLYTRAQWATYLSVTGLEANSPVPEDFDGDFTDSPDDLHIGVGSAAKDAGVDVSLTTDYDGISFEDPPSIGAYEYVAP